MPALTKSHDLKTSYAKLDSIKEKLSNALKDYESQSIASNQTNLVVDRIDLDKKVKKDIAHIEEKTA